ncbi:MAG: spore germination protein, partial [Syntrophomonadaceae bacterium]|nr:spore germination protein [Syntrophomonadaceae bacterium]
MIKYLSKKMKLAQLLKDDNKKDKTKVEEKSRPATLSTDLKTNLDLFSGIMGNSPDFIVRHFTFGKNRAVKAALLFMDGLADKKIINESIIKPLMYDIHLFDKNQLEMRTMEDIENILLSVGDVQHEAAVDTMISRLLYGDTIMLVDGYQEVLIIDTKGWQSRSIQEPPNERVVRGPREGFTETIRFNTAMLRRKINNPDLTVEQVIVGQKTHTYVALVYLKGIVNPKLVEEVKQRLKRIKTDAILESGYIEQFIEDSPLSLFTTVGNTEKPDVAAAKILEGRVAILIDGSPMVLTVPMLFVEGFQSAEDYYSRPYTASLLRMLRFASFFITLLSPALYVAMTTYHQEFIPTPLLITMKAASE